MGEGGWLESSGAGDGSSQGRAAATTAEARENRSTLTPPNPFAVNDPAPIAVRRRPPHRSLSTSTTPSSSPSLTPPATSTPSPEPVTSRTLASPLPARLAAPGPGSPPRRSSVVAHSGRLFIAGPRRGYRLRPAASPSSPRHASPSLYSASLLPASSCGRRTSQAGSIRPPRALLCNDVSIRLPLASPLSSPCPPVAVAASSAVVAAFHHPRRCFGRS
nr:proline-rich receptor-like protein kinase PERK9 [Aegilops tauschii subsp. strangulata]